MSEIEHRTVMATLNDVVNEAGADYVYPRIDNQGGCYYNRPDYPRCIVGKVLSRIVPDFKPPEGVGVMGFARALREAGFSDTSILALYMAQRLQDKRHTWGAAYEAARHVDGLLYSARHLVDGA